jgi:hypothetical protein
MSPAALDAANQAWIAETQRLGLKVVLKRPVAPLPSNCVGVLVIYDEPNGKGIPPAAVQAEADKIRAAFPGVKVFASIRWRQDHVRQPPPPRRTRPAPSLPRRRRRGDG